MRTSTQTVSAIARGASAMAVVVALLHGGAVLAQTGPATTAAAEEGADIVVTGSRIQRAGFDAPTPTTVVGEIDLRQGNRPNIGLALNDQPQFRPTSTPQSTTGNTGNSTICPDLRGLGCIRTLPLLDGHRFIGGADFNTLPSELVKRVDVVTGGASAAYGSGAVAGVVNVILDDDLKGLTLGADGGISSRGDGSRTGFNGSYGTKFAEGRGHIMVAASYLQDNGAFGRDNRPNLDAAIFGQANGQLRLANNVNYTIINTAGSVLRLTAAPYFLSFNPTGTSVVPLPLGTETNGQFTVGGAGQSLYDYVAVSSPYKRLNAYGRASYEFSDAARLHADFSFARMHSNFNFFPETPTAVIAADNAYLTPTIKSQLAAAGVTYPFVLGKILTDVGPDRYIKYNSTRRTLEGSLGLDGKIGKFKYNLYYDHGETRSDQTIGNIRITKNFNQAVDAVTNAAGQIVCRVNAVTVTDPGCAPINLFGNVPITGQALSYAFGGTHGIQTSKLDTAGGSISGSVFNLPAGPVDVAAGFDWRKEQLITNFIDPLSAASAFSTINFAPTNGAFNVKEGFGEINVPVFDIPQALHVEINGAARYSDYSTSGGIWTWKYGATVRVVNDLLFRGLYSRDIRSPTIGELYSLRGTNIGNVNDPYNRTAGTPTPQANVTSFFGGNAGLKPEIAHTMTLGGSYSPHYIRGFSLSVDYYRIKIAGAIATLSAQDALTNCYARSTTDATCGGLINRAAPSATNPVGAINFITRTYQNLASYKTQGVDVELAYVMAARNILPSLGGQFRLSSHVNYTPHLYINTGVQTIDRAGDVGDTATFTTPKWRGNAGLSYNSQVVGLDLRLRYIGGGKFDHTQAIINNDVAARAYVDLGFQLHVAQRFTIFGSIANLFDRQPPYVTYASQVYDQMGRYYSGGVRVKF